MTPKGTAAIAAVMSILLFSPAFALAAGQGIGSAINLTRQYVDSVNQSAYLVFYPNLTAAYGYIGEAVNESTSGNISGAYRLLNLSVHSATTEEARIQAYAMESLAVLVAVGACTAALLYRYMRVPRRNARKP